MNLHPANNDKSITFGFQGAVLTGPLFNEIPDLNRAWVLLREDQYKIVEEQVKLFTGTREEVWERIQALASELEAKTVSELIILKNRISAFELPMIQVNISARIRLAAMIKRTMIHRILVSRGLI